jgi:hypothetical protein
MCTDLSTIKVLHAGEQLGFVQTSHLGDRTHLSIEQSLDPLSPIWTNNWTSWSPCALDPHPLLETPSLSRCECLCFLYFVFMLAVEGLDFSPFLFARFFTPRRRTRSKWLLRVTRALRAPPTPRGETLPRVPSRHLRSGLVSASLRVT